MERNRVIVIGSLNYDLFLHVRELPRLGETYQATGMQAASGGKGANQAVQCARLGLDTTLVGAVGSDSMGDYLLEHVAAYGVRTEHIRRLEGPTGLGVVHVPEDGNVFSTIVRGANGLVTREDVRRVEPLMREAFAVVLQLEIPIDVVEYAMQTADQNGARVILNAAPAQPIAENALRLCDTLIVNEVEAGFFTKRCIRTVEDALSAIAPYAAALGVRAVFTLGAQGAVAFDGGEPFHVPAVKADVVETTGAGDSFVGGYLKAQSLGMGFADAIRFAAQCSAFTIAKVGGQDAMPTLEQMRKFLKN